MELTPAERRGALVLLLLTLIGAGWDLLHRTPRPAPAVEAVAVPTAVVPPPAAAPAPAGAPAAAAAGASRGKVPPAAPIDLNAASAADLGRLPGIGPVLAARIVAHRAAHGAFRSADELRAVRGIGPKLWARLRPLVHAGAAARTAPPDSLHFAIPGRH